MTAALLAIAGAGIFIAYANGANDVSKGVATLVGSGVTSYRRAIVWGAVWTGLGGLAGAALAGAMLQTFGHGLLASGATPTVTAAIATVVGAGAWVAIATRTGLPVSTTHAIVGALAGVGAVAYGLDGIRWDAVQHKLVLPLVLGPFVALALTAALVRVTTRPGRARDCVCLEPACVVPAVTADGMARVALAPARLVVAPAAECAVENPTAARITIDHLHWLTSGLTSFARGLNDAPKIVALILAGAVLAGDGIPASIWFAVVTAAMVAGSVVGGRRVTRVLAERVTRMDHRDGFLANLVTSTLVGLGAVNGLPLSTTHVSTGAIIGAGLRRPGAIRWQTVRSLVLAWLVTVPAAAGLGLVVYAALRVVGS